MDSSGTCFHHGRLLCVVCCVFPRSAPCCVSFFALFFLLCSGSARSFSMSLFVITVLLATFVQSQPIETDRSRRQTARERIMKMEGFTDKSIVQEISNYRPIQLAFYLLCYLSIYHKKAVNSIAVLSMIGKLFTACSASYSKLKICKCF